jgi:release factor glutamine methyltransferase
MQEHRAEALKQPRGGLVSSVGAWLARQADLPRWTGSCWWAGPPGCRAARCSAVPSGCSARCGCRPDQWAARRRAGEPLAYITGEREFWGLSFEVSPSVLVPRPETELLVEVALALADTAPGAAAGRFWLDLGTGSGAVAIALASGGSPPRLDGDAHRHGHQRAALVVAARNGNRYSAGVEWRRADWFHGIEGRFEFIVSNPPYVAEGDPHLAELRCEPRGALTAGPDGLRDLRRIVAGAVAHLYPGGWLVLEHGADQGAPVRSLLHHAGLSEVATATDLAGHERVTCGRRPAHAPGDGAAAAAGGAA